MFFGTHSKIIFQAFSRLFILISNFEIIITDTTFSGRVKANRNCFQYAVDVLVNTLCSCSNHEIIF